MGSFDAKLESEIRKLKTEIKTLKTEVNNLHDKIGSSESHINAPLDKKQVDILLLLYNRNALSENDVAQFLGLSIQITKFHIEELKARKMVSDVPPPSGKHQHKIFRLALSHEGTRYLIDYKLIS